MQSQVHTYTPSLGKDREFKVILCYTTNVKSACGDSGKPRLYIRKKRLGTRAQKRRGKSCLGPTVHGYPGQLAGWAEQFCYYLLFSFPFFFSLETKFGASHAR